LSENDDAIFKPSDYVRYVAENKKVPIESIKVPKQLVVTYQKLTYEYTKKLIDGKHVEWWRYDKRPPFCVGRFNNIEVGLCLFWIGAPAATILLEELIVCGAEKIFEVGTGGGLQSFLNLGDIIVAKKAIRDEGTSHHYLLPEVEVESSRFLRERLVKCLNEKKVKHFVGPVWSTDAVYRESRSKLVKFKDVGVLAVNMETSAVFAVARFRRVKAASAQVISDIITDNGLIRAADGNRLIRERSDVLVKVVLEALSKS
jgi:uridine phosphorylase